MTATYAAMKSLTRRTKVVGHKVYMDNFFSSPDFYDDLHKRTVICCATPRQNRKDMLVGFDHKTEKPK
jgi:hypothetical protein